MRVLPKEPVKPTFSEASGDILWGIDVGYQGLLGQMVDVDLDEMREGIWETLRHTKLSLKIRRIVLEEIITYLKSQFLKEQFEKERE